MSKYIQLLRCLSLPATLMTTRAISRVMTLYIDVMHDVVLLTGGQSWQIIAAVPVILLKTGKEQQKQVVREASTAAGILKTIPSAPRKQAKKGGKTVTAIVIADRRG